MRVTRSGSKPMRRDLDLPPILIQKPRTSGRIGQGNGVRVDGHREGEHLRNRVKGHLGGWSEWSEGLEIYNMENGEAVMSGEIVDQAALRGVLTKARKAGIAAGRRDPFRSER